MTYEITHKSDFQTGATLIARIPESDADKKALYTITREQPDFLLPFRHRVIDGEIEFAYPIGSCGKFAYFQKNRTSEEYISLLQAIIQPPLGCGDLFMSPYSFLLKTEYLYFDKTGKTAKFVYIPSKRPCSERQDLKNMVAEVAKQIQISDVNLENKVVWAIQDFDPDEFLQMLKSYKTEKTEKPGIVSAPEQKKPDDIDIDFHRIEKAPKAPREKPGKKSFFGFMADKKEKKEKMKQTPERPASEMPDPAPLELEDVDLTQLVETLGSRAARFRYAGSGSHPETIEIEIDEGNIFTIGRFDMSAGVKQSNFEFEAKTKAVSRRHAAVERNAEGYFLVDLSSSAGTFLDGQKLPPNAPFKLEQGCKVSFGFSGAEYVWES